MPPVYNDIVVGSGIAALGVVMGLAGRGRSVLAICGPASGRMQHYPGAQNVPAAHLGAGGLGQYWHGVIPLALRSNFADSAHGAFSDLLTRFYSRSGLAEAVGEDRFFVPWKPIRPAAHFADLDGTITRQDGAATAIEPLPAGGARVRFEGGHAEAGRVWVAAGALHSPALLAHSLGWPDRERRVSDHVIGYAGQLEGTPDLRARLLELRRRRDGVVFPCFYSADGETLYTLRPARFDFARLDHGIERRAVFGLPTSRAVAGIAGRFSAGLVSEALFNKAGLFPGASLYSVYFQTTARDAYALDATGILTARDAGAIATATDRARRDAPFDGLIPSNKPDLFIPGIHLHGSLNAVERTAIEGVRDTIRLVDPSVFPQIGPEHHSFKILLNAFLAARESE